MKPLALFTFENPTRVIGMNMIAWAKIIGITFAAFTFKGMYCLAPPYCLLPTIFFAYCTGIFLVPCTRRMANAMTSNRTTSSIRNITKPPVLSVIREINSWNKDCGKRAIIPTIIIKEIPLPIPLSVILSPSHKINILPAANIMVEVSINRVQSNEAFKEGPACILRLSK